MKTKSIGVCTKRDKKGKIIPHAKLFVDTLKTETEIAEEKINIYKTFPNDNTLLCCQEHKATCQRFLEFLEAFITIDDKNPDKQNYNGKIADLKNAIKLYTGVGI